MNPAVELRDVFRVHSSAEGDAAALQGLSLSVDEDEIVTVLGPSGAGKTTLLRIIAGLERPSAGAVRAFGFDLGRLPGRAVARYRASTIGYVDQHYTRALAPELPALELVGLKLRMAGVSRGERLARSTELLERVGLADKARVRPGALSGGEQQRIAVCAALADRPRLLLADEPTGELDEANASLVYKLIRELADEQSCTVIMVSHDPSSATIADRAVHIRDGRVSSETARTEGPDELVVVGRGGWLRLPEHFLARAHIGSHARVTVDARRIVVTAPDPDASQAPAHTSVPLERFVREVGARAKDDPVAELREVTRTYGQGPTAVHAIPPTNGSFAGDRFYAVTGPSGSGKTTLLNLLGGLDLATSGDVVLLGQRLSKLDREERATLRRDRVAIIGQHSPLVPFFSARENVELALDLRGRRLRGRSGQPRPSLPWICSTGPIIAHPASRAASRHASPSLAQSPSSRFSCSLTSRPHGSTRRTRS